MENLFNYLTGNFSRRTAAPAFDRYFLDSTGCSALLLSGRPALHYKLTPEGERIYFYEHDVNGVRYGLILVTMKTDHALPQAENILVQYLNRIRKPFGIACNLMMEITHTPAAVELTDYWQDESGTDWKIKGLCNGKVLAVLYVKNIGRCRVAEHDAYLKGFRFSSPLQKVG